MKSLKAQQPGRKAKSKNPAQNGQDNPNQDPSMFTDWGSVINTYARLSLKEDQLKAQNQPIPEDLTKLKNAIEMDARSYLTPQEQQLALRQVQDLKSTLYFDLKSQNAETIKANALRARDAVSRNVTKGLLGEKDGLNYEQYKQVTDPKSKTVKLPVQRAFIDREGLEKRAKQFGKVLGLENPTAKTFHAKLDQLLDTRTNNPKAYEKQVEGLKMPKEKMDAILDEWTDESFALAWTERLNKQDDENKVPFEEDVPISDDNRRRVDLIKNVTEAAADGIRNGDKDLEEEWVRGENYISPAVREEAVRETLRIRREAQRAEPRDARDQRESSDEPDAIGQRDAIIRAMDRHTDDYEYVEVEDHG